MFFSGSKLAQGAEAKIYYICKVTLFTSYENRGLMTKVVRVTDKTYEALSVLAGELQVRAKKIVSLDDAVAFLLAKNSRNSAEFFKNLKKQHSRGRKRRFNSKQSRQDAIKRHPEHFRSVA